jgi:hypothetical protein
MRHPSLFIYAGERRKAWLPGRRVAARITKRVHTHRAGSARWLYALSWRTGEELGLRYYPYGNAEVVWKLGASLDGGVGKSTVIRLYGKRNAARSGPCSQCPGGDDAIADIQGMI